jgi:hypothetical protein
MIGSFYDYVYFVGHILVSSLMDFGIIYGSFTNWYRVGFLLVSKLIGSLMWSTTMDITVLGTFAIWRQYYSWSRLQIIFMVLRWIWIRSGIPCISSLWLVGAKSSFWSTIYGSWGGMAQCHWQLTNSPRMIWYDYWVATCSLTIWCSWFPLARPCSFILCDSYDLLVCVLVWPVMLG